VSPSPAAIVLAAGKGTRMKSDLPKVLHPAAGEPMVRHVVDALREIGASPIVLVVGHGAELVREAFSRPEDADLRFALQAEQLGTGHAVQCGLSALASEEIDRDLVVLCGDGPLVRGRTLAALLEAHRSSGAAATLATSRVADPTGYGRIARDERGRFRAIVEHADASESERAIDEINPSVYAFRGGTLASALPRVGRGNAKGEIYLTDVFSLLLADEAAGSLPSPAVEVVPAVPPEEVLSVNDPVQLAEVDRILRDRAASEGGRS
jgi:bifunctional UDP-N-acetylglucosamine pyrophosphorylase/glucosamine-1-phosphate N-acetyltransferase